MFRLPPFLLCLLLIGLCTPPTARTQPPPPSCFEITDQRLDGSQALTSGGGHAWIINKTNVYKFDPASSSIVDTLRYMPELEGSLGESAEFPQGIAYVDGALYVLSTGTPTLYKLDPESGELSTQAQLASSQLGLPIDRAKGFAWDGLRFWSVLQYQEGEAAPMRLASFGLDGQVLEIVPAIPGFSFDWSREDVTVKGVAGRLYAAFGGSNLLHGVDLAYGMLTPLMEVDPAFFPGFYDLDNGAIIFLKDSEPPMLCERPSPGLADTPETGVAIHGKVTWEDTPVTAMVLANGAFTFSTGPGGYYSLANVPVDGEGRITIQTYAAGLAPKVETLTPEQATLAKEIPMVQDAEAPSFSVAFEVADSGSAHAMTGSVSYFGEPVCALALANGQYAFSCEGAGAFSLSGIPTDGNGQITLQVFAAGFTPYSTTITP